MDDMAVTGSSIQVINKFKQGMKGHFKLTDIGEIHWFLGFEIRRERKDHTISINQ
jgi:hypothetical protein